MKRCKKKGCNNIINNKERYCDFHKQQNVQNGIKGVGGIAAIGLITKSAWDNKSKIIKNGKVIGDFVVKNGTELGKILLKKF